MLTEQDVSHYRTHGYLLKDGLIDLAMIAEARRVIAEFVARSVEVTGHTDVYDLEPGHHRAGAPGAPHQDAAQAHAGVLGNVRAPRPWSASCSSCSVRPGCGCKAPRST